MTKQADASRRRFLLQSLFGSGYLGLRALATGLPAAVLANPRLALADEAPAEAFANPQFLILNTSAAGDPINCNAPGTYEDPGIFHSSDPRMEKTSLTIGGARRDAAKPWATLGDALGRASFLHHATGTNQHLHQAEVLALRARVRNNDMAISAYASLLAPVLGTIQSQPVSLGADGTAEAISAQGRSQPMLTPRSLSDVLGGPKGLLSKLETIRDRDLNKLNAFYKQHGNAGQRAFLDRYAASQGQARKLSTSLLSRLAALTSNGPSAQVQAAVILIQMNVAPAYTVHIPFGGDNHIFMGPEVDEHVSGVATIVELMNALRAADLQDRVTFASMNVFGRTLLSSNGGRNHNQNLHMTLMIGKNVKSSVIGGVTRMKANGLDDYGAMPIASSTGKGDAGGDISFDDSLPSVAKTLGVALGVPRARVDEVVVGATSGTPVGKVIGAAVNV